MTTEVHVSDSLALDDQLCFALYAASRAVTGVYRPLLDELGLTYPQYLVLLVLWGRGSSPVKDLAAALHLDYGTLTPLLKRLESAGFVRRERRKGDERTVDIVLTADGKALRDRARRLPPAISQAMGLTTAEVDTLRALLRKVSTNIATP
ncbi:MarR family winged helix-turn-helix transcriptional regulator [Phytohabitans rumicis]|uniref:MarR family transcriptional regulator n=1 Tax=Phytohabitans rumicis TaxID=1076125 RepID=A0A6V8LDW4_9ACTN|nr:MarR family transcriptional regulator [Phytohabitans rumicis]GFJ95423.1 MarR family transcriptional regulator [Phytohabitans rumicis]